MKDKLYGLLFLSLGMVILTGTATFAVSAQAKEGSALFSKGDKYPSLRADVPMEGILPIMAPRHGDVYATQKYRDFGQVKGDMRKVAADAFAPLLK